MLVTTGSSPIESVVASGNIFVGQVSCNINKIKRLLKWILSFQKVKLENNIMLFSVERRVST